MYNGILPVYKERGLTSHDVVFKLRKILKTKKVGHTGTLDPEVSGVLPICIGSATKVSDYIMEMGKTYLATVYLGFSTTTEDQTGEILAKKNIEENTLKEAQIDSALARFEGVITQIPPMYSSVKVNGKKLYEYARKNETVERPSREVEIYDIKRASDLRFENQGCQFDIRVKCGKGTYIRTLATDIGKVLDIPAHMSKLTRIQSGGFDIEDSLSIEHVQALHEHETLQEKLFPIEYGLRGLKKVNISNENQKFKILNGQKFNKNEFDQSINTLVVMFDTQENKALAIYTPHPDKPYEIKPKKVFN